MSKCRCKSTSHMHAYRCDLLSRKRLKCASLHRLQDPTLNSRSSTKDASQEGRWLACSVIRPRPGPRLWARGGAKQYFGHCFTAVSCPGWALGIWGPVLVLLCHYIYCSSSCYASSCSPLKLHVGWNVGSHIHLPVHFVAVWGKASLHNMTHQSHLPSSILTWTRVWLHAQEKSTAGQSNKKQEGECNHVWHLCTSLTLQTHALSFSHSSHYQAYLMPEQ